MLQLLFNLIFKFCPVINNNKIEEFNYNSITNIINIIKMMMMSSSIPIYGFSSSSCPSRIPTLHYEVLDDSVEFNIVVVTSAREFNEIPASSRCMLVVKLKTKTNKKVKTLILAMELKRKTKKKQKKNLDGEGTHGSFESNLWSTTFCTRPHLALTTHTKIFFFLSNTRI